MRFLIGAATSAHQTEGNNIFSDCWAMEQMPFSSFREPSGAAVDHYHRFAEDIRLLAQAGLNAYRFSLEWSRIEPQEGKFSEEEIAHYRSVLDVCRSCGVEPIVTMHHFSSPRWLIVRGGWENGETPDLFARYCAFVAERLGDRLRYVCTINEANMGRQIAAFSQKAAEGALQLGIDLNEMKARAKQTAEENRRVFGTDAPAVFLSARSEEGDRVIAAAHCRAREVMKRICPHLRVGLTLSLHDIQAREGGERAAAAAWKDEFSRWLPAVRGDDFIGVQNYTRTVCGPQGELPVSEEAEKTQMGYEFYPEALEHVVRRVYSEAGLPVLVTENGVATEDDRRRCAFVERALQGVLRCREEQIPLIGYLYWSLLDNFEWQKGYGMKFGLIAVDRTTMRRVPKKSLFCLGEWTKRAETLRKELKY